MGQRACPRIGCWYILTVSIGPGSSQLICGLSPTAQAGGVGWIKKADGGGPQELPVGELSGGWKKAQPGCSAKDPLLGLSFPFCTDRAGLPALDSCLLGTQWSLRAHPLLPAWLP